MRTARGLSITTFWMTIWAVLFCSCLDPNEAGNLVPPTVDEDPSLPQAALRDTVFHLETFGDPTHPAIFVLHGGPGHDYRCMLSLIEADDGSLADNYYFIFWDQRGAGLSRRHSDESLFTFEHYLGDLETIIDTYAPKRQVILLGHSWGGGYAAMYMNAHPERIAGAILLEPMSLSAELQKQLPEYTDSVFNEWSMDWIWIRQLIGQNSHCEADYAMAATVSGEIMQYRMDRRHPFWREGAAVHLFMDPLLGDKYNFTENLHQVSPEVLFVAGEKTKDLGAAFQHLQLACFNYTRLEVVSDAGHYDLVWARADATRRIIADYLATLDLDGARP